MAPYARIHELLTYFEAFEREEKSQDLKAFSLWLYRQENRRTGPPSEEQMQKMVGVGKYTFYHDFSTEKKLGILIGRLARFARNYAKKAMQGLPITTLDEFTYLAGITGDYTPSKSELINAHYMEMTSGSEIIRRLVKMGLVEEITDAADKRLKRLRITPEGEAVRSRAIEQMGEVAQLVAGNLTDDEKAQAVALLTQLDSFHVDVNGRDTDATLAELIGRHIIGRS